MSVHHHDHPTTGPYGHAAGLYWTAGWRGVLPLPPHRKASPPPGWTGRTTTWPSYPDLAAWTDEHADGNLALRLPHHVIGIDVDNYDTKTGGTTLTALEAAFGHLPPTWRTTSRDDRVSGIRLYRVPEGLAWPGDLGAGIEIIQWSHRYALAWPSIHPEGRTYRWIDPAGHDAIGVIPAPDDLPDLPDEWVTGISRGTDTPDQPRTPITTPAAANWLTGLPDTTPCPATSRALTRHLTDLGAATRSRHDTALAATMRLTRLGAEGHHGTPTALLAFRRAWETAIADSRDPSERDAEWTRLLAGAIAAVHDQTPASTDPCTNPFAGILQE
ncbi:bifunctional DNA primase/polymerase, partial [Enterococcus hirae]|uniref:bifunctional DNA primase/polymerase n=1 Tax=Enterococcus hirae TaxID=1354 RepID=UPI00136C7E69